MKLDHRRPFKESSNKPIVFCGIDRLYTLAGAAKKSGRKITHKDLSLIQKAAFVCLDGKILWIGHEAKLPKGFVNLKSHSFKGATLLPGFVESHTHLIYGGTRACEFDWRNQGMSYQEIARRGGGILSSLKQTRAMKANALLVSAQKKVDEFIKQGVTTLEVKSGYALNFEGEKRLLKIAGKLKKIQIIRTYLGAHALPREFQTTKDYIEHLTQIDLPKIKKQKLASRVDIFVEKGFFSKADGKKYLKAAQRLGFDLTIHADQLSLSGGSELAFEMAASSADHLIQIGENEISKFAIADVTATLLPGADLYMNCSYPPARKLIDAGARVALATDFNPGTCPTQDLSLIGVLARIQMKMTLAEVIGAYTIGGAYALRLQDQIGSLEVGKAANFCVLDSDIDDLFYQIGHSPITQTWFEAKRIFS
jgi:imidazolonepropionase